ncbi:MAG TPA: PAS domain-containing protein, partial [Acidimicrobiia bacterium]|nr:PAS domain-containing protein [Acidimicrobiia bacterium]
MLAVHAPRARAGGHEQDVAAVLLVARGRVLLATALVLGASLLTDRSGSADVLLAVGGYLWVPFAATIALAASPRTVRVVRPLGAAGDLVMLFALHRLVGASAAIVLAGYSLVVVLGAYTGGRRFGLVLAGAAMALVLFAERLLPSAERLDVPVIALFSVTLALLLVVVDRAASEQRRAEARSARLATKADAILARVADGVVVTDAAGVVIEANPAAEQLVGVRSLAGRSCGDVLSLCSGERQLDCSVGC